MARTVTSCTIKWNDKSKCYVITTTDQSDDGWTGTTTGAKIYPVSGYLVHTAWGTDKPIAVYQNTKHMLLILEKHYKVKPVLIDSEK